MRACHTWPHCGPLCMALTVAFAAGVSQAMESSGPQLSRPDDADELDELEQSAEKELARKLHEMHTDSAKSSFGNGGGALAMAEAKTRHSARTSFLEAALTPKPDTPEERAAKAYARTHSGQLFKGAPEHMLAKQREDSKKQQEELQKAQQEQQEHIQQVLQHLQQGEGTMKTPAEMAHHSVHHSTPHLHLRDRVAGQEDGDTKPAHKDREVDRGTGELVDKPLVKLPEKVAAPHLPDQHSPHPTAQSPADKPAEQASAGPSNTPAQAASPAQASKPAADLEVAAVEKKEKMTPQEKMAPQGAADKSDAGKAEKTATTEQSPKAEKTVTTEQAPKPESPPAHAHAAQSAPPPADAATHSPGHADAAQDIAQPHNTHADMESEEDDRGWMLPAEAQSLRDQASPAADHPAHQQASANSAAAVPSPAPASPTHETNPTPTHQANPTAPSFNPWFRWWQPSKSRLPSFQAPGWMQPLPGWSTPTQDSAQDAGQSARMTMGAAAGTVAKPSASRMSKHGCACSGVSNPAGFGSYCLPWEDPTQMPWCYVDASCETGTEPGDYGKFDECLPHAGESAAASANAQLGPMAAAVLPLVEHRRQEQQSIPPVDIQALLRDEGRAGGGGAQGVQQGGLESYGLMQTLREIQVEQDAMMQQGRKLQDALSAESSLLAQTRLQERQMQFEQQQLRASRGGWPGGGVWPWTRSSQWNMQGGLSGLSLPLRSWEAQQARLQQQLSMQASVVSQASDFERKLSDSSRIMTKLHQADVAARQLKQELRDAYDTMATLSKQRADQTTMQAFLPTRGGHMTPRAVLEAKGDFRRLEAEQQDLVASSVAQIEQAQRLKMATNAVKQEYDLETKHL